MTPDQPRLINRPEYVPVLTFPGITQETFADAFEVLDEALVCPPADAPVYGFTRPFCGPGGAYGPCWWQLDTSLATSGIKWVNPALARGVLRDFMDVQLPDGRIPLYGPDNVVDENNRCSSLPKLFLTACDLLCMTGHTDEDEALIRDTYGLLRRYLDWWFAARRHPDTGLISGIFEEWLPGTIRYIRPADSSYLLPVETSVEVAEGCLVVEKLASYLGLDEDAALCRRRFESLAAAIDGRMWDEAHGCFMNLTPDGSAFTGVRSVTCFSPLRCGIADEGHRARLLSLLTDGTRFNWDTNPLTSADRTDPRFIVKDGVYDACQWYGSIWSLRSYDVIRGLDDIGRYDLSAYLSLRTVRLFNGNYAEFLNPDNGSGQGVLRYAWSAAQYAQILIEEIFGVRFDRFAHTLTVFPRVDPSLCGQTLKLENLLLPDGNRLDVTVLPGKEETTVSARVRGEAEPDYDVILSLPLPGGVKAVPCGRTREAAYTFTI